MDPAEAEFIAEREPIKIVPKFTAGTIYLLQGDYGPFKAGLVTTVSPIKIFWISKLKICCKSPFLSRKQILVIKILSSLLKFVSLSESQPSSKGILNCFQPSWIILIVEIK